MATHPMGKGTKTIGLNMKKPMADEIDAGQNLCKFQQVLTAK